MNTPFRTVNQTPKQLPAQQIEAMQSIVGLGSCFAMRMGERFARAKFPTSLNPMGIAYHPLALADFLHWGMGAQPIIQPVFADHTESWTSFDLHSTFNHADEEGFRVRVAKQLQVLQQALEGADWLLLTFGTAIVYRQLEDLSIVNNCHKFPASQFVKSLLDLKEMMTTWHATIDRLKAYKPDLQIILTVSPIRHIKEGLPQNSVSKALLRVVAEQLSGTHEQVHYFPAFELMMDDLRDYRFYESDMIHPNAVAQQYIWDQFAASWLSPSAQQQVHTWQRIEQGLQHQSLQPWSSANQAFLQQLKGQIVAFAETYEIDCTPEITQIEDRLSA